MTKRIEISERFSKLHRPLCDDERKLLEEDIRQHGVIVAVVLWRGVLIDGHNRYQIAQKLGIECPTVDMEFEDEAAAVEWVIRNQLARRNLSQRDYRLLLGQLYNEQKQARGGDKKPKAQNEPLVGTAEKVAKEHGTSRETVKRAGKTAEAYDAAPRSARTLYDQGKLTDAQLKKLSKMDPSDAVQATRDIRVGRKPAKEAIPSGPKKDLAYFKRQAQKQLDYVMRTAGEMLELAEDMKRHAEVLRLLDKIRDQVDKW